MKKIIEFFKTNFHYIAKYSVNKLVMSFFGIFVGLPTIYLNNMAVSIIASIVAICLLCFIEYDFMFQLGEKHCYLPIDQEKPAKTLGMKIGLCGSLISIVLIIIGLLFRVLYEKATGIVLIIYLILNGTYIQPYALLKDVISIPNNEVLSGCICWCLCLVLLMPGILAATLGYYLGSIDKPLRTLLGIKVNRKSDNQK